MNLLLKINYETNSVSASCERFFLLLRADETFIVLKSIVKILFGIYLTLDTLSSLENNDCRLKEAYKSLYSYRPKGDSFIFR